MIRPVIVGIGEIKDRPKDPALGLDPIGLMATAAQAAQSDSGHALLTMVDAVEVIHQISWRYEDTARKLCERIGIDPPRAVYHHGGGESPLRVLHDSAIRIAEGESKITLICGGEARSTIQKARKEGVTLPWPAKASAMEHPWRVEEMVSVMGRAHGIAQPTYIYPLYENATLHAWGQTPAEAHAESAQLWARYSSVAAQNPYAWMRDAVPGDVIATAGLKNPTIAWPYTRLMVANPTVNQGAAMLVMDEQTALELGIDPRRLLYVAGGAASTEAEDYLDRDVYHGCASQQVVLETVMDMNGGNAFDQLELYSCFPCVPKMARRTLRLGEDVIPTVTGGLTFFGGPYNNYMLHAACAMTRRLRDDPGTGLLYGQGSFVTKHHGLILSSSAPAEPLARDYRQDGRADALRGPLPQVVDRASGEAKVESFTVLYDRANAVDRGIVILRTPDGARTMARVPPGETATIARLTDPSRSPIGENGIVTTAQDGLLEWRLS